MLGVMRGYFGIGIEGSSKPMNAGNLFRSANAFGASFVFTLGGTIAWSAIYTYLGMVEQGHAEIKDILLLFIYLELGAMVGVHFKTRRLPVEFLLYIAITALTRLLAINLKAMADERIMVISGAIVVITIAVFILHVGRAKFPSDDPV